MVLEDGFNASGNSYTMSDPVPKPLSKTMQLLDNYQPILPNSVVENCLQEAGFHTDDERLVKLISVCGQKYISDILNDAIQIHKARTANPTSNNAKSGNRVVKDRRYHLMLEDVITALGESGIDVAKPSYFV